MPSTKRFCLSSRSTFAARPAGALDVCPDNAVSVADALLWRLVRLPSTCGLKVGTVTSCRPLTFMTCCIVESNAGVFAMTDINLGDAIPVGLSFPGDWALPNGVAAPCVASPVVGCRFATGLADPGTRFISVLISGSTPFGTRYSFISANTQSMSAATCLSKSFRTSNVISMSPSSASHARRMALQVDSGPIGFVCVASSGAWSSPADSFV